MKILAFVITPLLAVGLIVVTIFWRNSVGQAEQLGQELNQTKDQVSSLESQVRDLNQNIDTLNTNLRDANSKVASGDEALRGKDSELSRAQTANSSLTQENSRLSSQVQQIAAAQKEAAAAKAEAGLYMEHVASQEASIVVLTQERDKLKAELEQAKKTISLLDVANNDVSWSLGYLGHPVFVPEMLPPDMDY